eukprot:SM000289S10413  [mRNA]  locus=s289:127673:133488:- [translate_table: standard]
MNKRLPRLSIRRPATLTQGSVSHQSPSTTWPHSALTCHCHGPWAEQDADDDLQAVQEMRVAVERQGDGLEARRDLLQRYYRALAVMESRFPISGEREHVNTLAFTWFDAIKQSRKATQQNIHFEKAAVAFNLGAVQSQLALSADRSTPAGLKQACNCFQAAAGAFAFLRDNIAIKAFSANPANCTPDVSVECAGMLERFMLAQAQECFFEKVLADGKPPALCSKVAKQVWMYYEEAYAALLLPPLNQHFDRTWLNHVQLKAAQFHAEAYFRVALDLHAQENIAEEIARLKAASGVISEVKKNSRGVVGPLVDAVSKLEVAVLRNLERANKENDRVYLMRVPSNDTLPPLPAATLVKSFPMTDVLDASNEKMFVGLVPDSSAKALSKYTEMVDNIIRTQAEKLEQESNVTRVKLKEMNMPDALLALEGTNVLPDHLRDDVEAVLVDGGPAGLQQELAQLKDLRRVNEELLVQTEETLEKESREDAQIRAQFGTRWTRPQSSTLTKNLRDRANGFAGNLKQAGESDARIEKAIEDNRQLLSVLSTQPVEAALPKLTRPIVSVHGNEDHIAATLRDLLADLEKLGQERAGLEDMLKDMKRKDNILNHLLTTSGSYEDLFKRELAKYDPVCAEVSQNVQAQQNLLQEIKVGQELWILTVLHFASSHCDHAQCDIFADAFNLRDHNAEKDKVCKQIEAAVAKYREIRGNINEGLKFYITLQDAITALKQQCSDYVMTRSIQCREMMEDLQRQIAGLSFDKNSKCSHVQAESASTQHEQSSTAQQQQQQQQHQLPFPFNLLQPRPNPPPQPSPPPPPPPPQQQQQPQTSYSSLSQPHYSTGVPPAYTGSGQGYGSSPQSFGYASPQNHWPPAAGSGQPGFYGNPVSTPSPPGGAQYTSPLYQQPPGNYYK